LSPAWAIQIKINDALATAQHNSGQGHIKTTLHAGTRCRKG